MEAQVSTPHAPLDFYRKHYVYLRTPSHLSPDMPRIILGNSQNRLCRYCGQSPPAVSFRHDAHVIPEALGNRCLFSKRECDGCNQYFGDSIETDLGNWSIVNRTLSGVRGKKGVPILKSDGSKTSWRITGNASGFKYQEYENSSIVTIDEIDSKITIDVKGASYTPIAVFKAFVKIGLTLLPDEEIKKFSETLSWVRNPDHSKGFAKRCSIISTFTPGLTLGDNIIAIILRRRPHSSDLPYIFLILGYGNHLFQIWLPCREKDENIWGTTLNLPPFPPIIVPQSSKYGKPRTSVLDLSGCEKVRDQSKPHVFEFESFEIRD